MNAAEISAELKEIVDRHAGRPHSAEGSVMTGVAELLTRYDQMMRAHLLAELRKVHAEAVSTAPDFGSTYAVDMVGKCIEIVQGNP